ncbi:PEP/pyruvate-binding domain-containing protein [Arthrobacter sp. I2-34]|uniref:Phosphoenolpyruvate synthase n=1 Tax=Arthrobacter hankyongi TaxID=2904801 RepID=A0ABS9L3C7_9MICC|nr:PEP/pyruvate-binding domain-containing protein [Arthrobacter hankyongi]MCG2621181.1 PEP/pyruvate-binding domain-containing protein [Arthrobacter hankyongi]
MYTLEFSNPSCQDVREVGGKAAGLAAMTAAGLPVAPGFAVTAAAYRRYLDEAGLRQFTSEVLGRLGPDAGQAAFDDAERTITARLAQVPLPQEVADGIRAAYAGLCRDTGVEDMAVAVRSSATAEDSVGASFAGEFETWVDITGAEDVLAYVHKCYLSVFAGRVLSYLAEKEIEPHAVEMAVVIQKTVRARSAGVMFTLSPTSGDRSKIVLEASWGLGLSVVGGEVTPDRFLVDKIGLAIVDRTPGHKHIEYRRGDAPQDVPAERREVLCLDDDEVVALATLGKRLEKIHRAPQDIEFAVDEELPPGMNLVLLQCRPETVWSNAERKPAFDASAGMMSWIAGSISGAPAATAADVEGVHTHSHKH